ncbi:hypothetical protein AVEN_24620-1 [Araneus ventricosus]|uniref:G-protein coupled receptors family 1 profile domain-containing protein n=1 Tax=Araneus ventricosus TaxID=182803 RepID=A0A4Y2IJ89_ARAVE|nr:hypothetical protein AVEN_24620-1 [Araneus ventricosus]
MRCLSNSLLITLAVSDLLVSIVCMPMAIGFYTYKLWIFGEVMCKLANYLQGSSKHLENPMSIDIMASYLSTRMLLDCEQLKPMISPERYREDSSTFQIPYFVAIVTKFVAKVGEPDVAAASHPVLIPVKLSSQP